MSVRRQRVVKLASGLTPQQVVLDWLEEALGYPSMVEYVRTLIGQPSSAYPLQRLPERAEEAVRVAMKGQPHEEVDMAVRQAVRDVIFLFHLHHRTNIRVLEEEEAYPLRYLLLLEKLQTLLRAQTLHADMLTAWWSVCKALPYPLDRETTATVTAAEEHYVESWEGLGRDGIILDWVTAAYADVGKTPLPASAYELWRSGAAPGEVPDAEDEAEVRVLFRDEEAWTAFLAGEDYSYGLADVPDHEVEERCLAVAEALHALIEAGEVEGGTMLRLESVPHLFLQDVPLVDGVWLDRTVVELAEWGARLQRAGWAVHPSDDDHPLAWARLAEPGSAERGAAGADHPGAEVLRVAARTHLDSFPGRTREIGGRVYLHITDYRAWRGRRVAAKHLITDQDGVVASSWNAWVEQHGGEGKARLAGVPVGRIMPYTEDARRETYDIAEAQERLREREEVLATLRTWTLTDPAHGSGYGGRTLPGERRSFRDLAREWQTLATRFLSDLYAMTAAVATVERRYFAGRTVLYRNASDLLARELASTERLVALFNEGVAARLDTRYPGRETGKTAGNGGESEGEDSAYSLDPAEVKDACGDNVALIARSLVDYARADALVIMGDAAGGHAIVERYLS